MWRRPPASQAQVSRSVSVAGAPSRAQVPSKTARRSAGGVVWAAAGATDNEAMSVRTRGGRRMAPESSSARPFLPPAALGWGRVMRRLLAALTVIATICAAMAAGAGAVPQSPDPRSAVRAGSGITYLDLLRRLFPDAAYDTAKEEVRAHKSVKIRNIAEGQEPTELESDITISGVAPTWMKSHGRPVLLLVIDVSAADANEATPYEGETTILAAFDVEAEVRQIDAIEVQTDRFADLWEKQPLVHLSTEDDAVVVHNTHFNAGESYDAYTLLFLDGGTFTVISDLTLFNTQGCGVSYTETPAYTAVPRKGRAYPDVALRVTLKKAADGPECDRRTAAFTRSYTATYSWDAKTLRYVGDLRGLDALDKFNRDRLK